MTYPNLPRHRGASLISVMVGLVLGLIAVVSVMSVYKSLVFKGTDMRKNARQDSQVGMALLAASLDIQKAGYLVAAAPSCLGATVQGPAGKANDDFVLIAAPVLTPSLPASSRKLTGVAQSITGTASTGSAVIWHWIDPATEVSLCAGLVATQGTVSPPKGGGLVRLAPMACTNATQWAVLTWTIDHLIADDSLPAATGTVANKAVEFSAWRQSCLPFGAGVQAQSSPPNALRLDMTAGNSTPVLASKAALCLPNICQ